MNIDERGSQQGSIQRAHSNTGESSKGVKQKRNSCCNRKTTIHRIRIRQGENIKVDRRSADAL